MGHPIFWENCQARKLTRYTLVHSHPFKLQLKPLQDVGMVIVPYVGDPQASWQCEVALTKVRLPLYRGYLGGVGGIKTGQAELQAP